MRTSISLFFLGTLMLYGCNTDHPATTAERRYFLEKIGPAQAVQLYADGFDQLAKNQKIFAYYLYLASIAARDIATDQHHHNALEVRDLFEEVYKHSGTVDPKARESITQYLKLFWINNSFYDNLTSRKFVPSCTFEEFTSAVSAAQASGAEFALDGETIGQKLERLKAVIFDPGVDAVMTNKTPGEDWIKSSAVNFYGKDITYSEVEKWAKGGNEKHPLNSTVVKEQGKLVEKVWRTDDGGTQRGRYAEPLGAAIGYLEKAIPFAASEHQAEVLRLLVKYYRTGESEDFRKFNIQWVKDSSSIDFIHGFIEVYLDPRGQKGEFEAILYFNDPEQTKMMTGLASFAQYFEDKAPWKDEYKKKIERSPIANVINVIVEVGGGGPVSSIGINLPNDQSIREDHGTKSVLLNNIVIASDKSSGKELLRELAWDEEEIQNQETYGVVAGNLHTAMHEVIGHGSGKASPKLGGKDPSDFLPGYYNTLEEARADLVALWNAWDPKLVDIGVAKDAKEARKIGETLYQQRVRTVVNQLRRIGKSEQLEEDHLKNRQMIVHYVMKNSASVRREERNGKTYYRIIDFDGMRASVGELLAEVMRIKAEGDLPAAKALVDTYGLKIDTKLRDQVQERVKSLNLPAYTGFVMPKLEPVNDPTAQIVDVTISYPLDLATQMLEYSAFTKPFRKSMVKAQ